MSFRLQVESGKGAGKTFYFDGGRVRIGRQSDNELVFYDTGVSRHHCEIYRAEEGYRIRDTGSSNGTFVDEEKVADISLRSGARIRLGPIQFTFTQGGERSLGDTSPSVVEVRPTSEFEEDLKTTAYQLSADSKISPNVTKRSSIPIVATLQKALGGVDSGQGKARSVRVLYASVLVFILCAGFLIYLLMNPREPDRSNELFGLTGPEARRSYGFGRVEVNTPDRVMFRFRSKRGRVRVRYAAGSIDDKAEVEILVNGRSLGFVPPSEAKWTKGIELRIAREYLVEGLNVLTFDNVLTPERSKRWGIAKLSIEETLLPEPDLTKATRLFELGQAAFETRSVAPENLYRAVKYLTESRIYVEGEDQPDPLLLDIERILAAAEEGLEQTYRSHLFAAEKAFRFGDRAGAVEKLRSLLRHFPDPEDTRHQIVKKKVEGLAGRH